MCFVFCYLVVEIVGGYCWYYFNCFVDEYVFGIEFFVYLYDCYVGFCVICYDCLMNGCCVLLLW